MNSGHGSREPGSSGLPRDGVAPPDGGSEARPRGGVAQGAARWRLRITYQKRGDLRFLSHLDLVRSLERALRRSSLPIEFSQGFNPRIRLSFPGALALGIESEQEEFDVGFTEVVDPEEARTRLNAVLPGGLEVLGVRPSPGRFAAADVSRYEIAGAVPFRTEAVRAACARVAMGREDLRLEATIGTDAVRVAFSAAGAGGRGPGANPGSGGTNPLKELIAALEAADPACSPLRVRKLRPDAAVPPETHEERLDGVEQRIPPAAPTARGNDDVAGAAGGGRDESRGRPGRDTRRRSDERPERSA